MKSIITTGNGDFGETYTLGGERLSKGHLIIECTGLLDRMRAQIALLRLHLIETKPEAVEDAAFLFWLLHCCFVIGSRVSDARNLHPEWSLGDIAERHLARLEAEQERMEATLNMPKAFVVSATSRLAATADCTAVTARDFERALVRLAEAIPELRDTRLFPFVNRLGDFFFILARYLEDGHHQTVDYSRLG